MRKHKKEVKIRDRYWDENLPSDNYDFKEVSVDNFEFLDKYILESAQVQQVLGSSFQGNLVTNNKERSQKRQRRLLRKILQAASQTLTDRQFQIFVLRFVFNLTQEEVAERVGHDFVGRPRKDKQTKKPQSSKPISQEYVCEVIKVCIKKIRKELRLSEILSEELSQES